MAQLSQEMQQKIQDFQEAQQQARVLLSQKYQIELQMKETQNALDELEKAGNTEVHKVVGQILIKSDKNTVHSELKEKVETLELRLKTIEKQEKKVMEKVKTLQEELQKGLAGLGGGNVSEGG
ncbi:TPA: prefoldin subunit beta [archaeon]|uniref:Prefoldin subunit beta n=1 Tax=Candidatus Naiadarchaeum limnaeum TaxID=2756139 RepID=A0A832X682_9ARCH|nr:prefoldin subunit beta [Candidatus Naiadarchaeales archaeon SRR2090153.bin1042]HIK00620.1 prefoldin subunit beta [Candidatus Naiadarchaeum limnaeum]